MNLLPGCHEQNILFGSWNMHNYSSSCLWVGKKRKIINFLKSQSIVNIYLLHQSSRFRKHISKWFTEYDCIFPFTILYDIIGKIEEIQTVGICSWERKRQQKSFILSETCSKYIVCKQLTFFLLHFIILSLWVFCLLVGISQTMQCPQRPEEVRAPNL